MKIGREKKKGWERGVEGNFNAVRKGKGGKRKQSIGKE